METTRKAPYSVYNDGSGPYAMFSCESCGRDYRAQPVLVQEVKETIAKSAFGGLLRNIPIVGNAAANQVDNDRYRNTLTNDELEKAWAEVKVNFAECQSCRKVVCIPDFDMASGFCKEDSPRSEELQARDAQQAGAAAAGFMSGIANAFGIPDAMKAAAAQQAAAQPPAAAAPTTTWPAAAAAPATPAAPTAAAAPCGSCGGALAAGAKFCANCATPVPVKAFCTGCGTERAPGAKFCANCGQPAA
ncbi:MAG: zinc ribbon domain-containing protein [Chloroflexota bacterium]